jgi:hypothetical protein
MIADTTPKFLEGPRVFALQDAMGFAPAGKWQWSTGESAVSGTFQGNSKSLRIDNFVYVCHCLGCKG